MQPLFPQLGEPWTLPAEQRKETGIDEFKGYLLEAFALRGRAAKLGWTRGAAEDGGVFSPIHKHFPGLGLLARLEFTGNTLPEANRTVALLGLAFERGGRRMALREVPPVLLGECRDDLAAIAAQGPDTTRVGERKRHGERDERAGPRRPPAGGDPPRRGAGGARRAHDPGPGRRAGACRRAACARFILGAEERERAGRRRHLPQVLRRRRRWSTAPS